MDPYRNPYQPGAGTRPPELAGRDEVLEKARQGLFRTKSGRTTRSLVLYGLRGVGKTVLLNHIRMMAEAEGLVSIRLEAPEDKSLPAVLIPAIQSALIKLSHVEALKESIASFRGYLSSFAKALRFTYQDIEFHVDATESVSATGDLETDLSDLLVRLGDMAQSKGTAVVFFIDEIQYFKEMEWGAFIAAWHWLNQSGLPVFMVAAGLPQVLGLSGKAKSYSERLFEYVPLGPLSMEAAMLALRIPALSEGVSFQDSALHSIFEMTQGYPYFLQEWGKHCWDVAQQSPVSDADVRIATDAAIDALDNSFFKVRFDRLTPLEKRYVQIMSELGAGPHRSGDIAEALGKPVSAVAPTRASLIRKGMIYAPGRGDTAFTVPLFDQFMRRLLR